MRKGASPPRRRQRTRHGGLRAVARSALLASLVLPACGVSQARAPEPVPSAEPQASATPASLRDRDFAVVKRYPHDPDAYTQGLFFREGFLYESTGRYGHSSLRRVELESGRVLQRSDLPDHYFGEGIAELDGRIYQLTWTSRRCFVYGIDDFVRREVLAYDSEGWGITTHGPHLVMSDGTATLRYMDPGSFEPVRSLEVRDAQGPVGMLNELELVEGSILANVWLRDLIVEISPESGAVTARFDLSALVSRERRSHEAVLNGIAYDTEGKRLFVTGKLWSHVYEVELRRAASP